jgi:uncharacterized integral membrane protein
VFRKIVTAIIVIPLAAVIISFAVANRQTVTVSFDPFSTVDPAYASTLPLFAVILLVLILGVLVGGIAAWIRQSKWRRTARQLEAENRALRAERDAARPRFAPAEPAPPEPTPYQMLPPVP